MYRLNYPYLKKRDGNDICLRNLIDDTILGLMINKVDSRGRLCTVWINDTFRNFMEYSFDEFKQQCFSIETSGLVHEDDVDSIKHIVSEILSGRKEEMSILFRTFRKTGGMNWIYLYTRRIEFQGNPDHLFSIGIDFTDHMLYNHKQLQMYAKELATLHSSDRLEILSDIEKDMIVAFAEGRSTKEIADLRQRSYETVNNQKRNIYRKLQINKLSELVAFAKDTGLY